MEIRKEALEVSLRGSGSTPVLRQVFFLEAPRGRRFAILTRPEGACRGALLYLHPFAEEMNKSRRMAALAARAFAGQGWAVLQLDHFGCGDSAGDFSEAGWQDWLDDVEVGYAWLQANVEAPPVIWSLRAGSLVAADWLAQSGLAVPLLMWQPVASGKQHLTQFLRLKAAADMLGEADSRMVMAKLREEIKAGQSIEVAGYGVAPTLAAGLEAATLRLPPAFGVPVGMLEVVAADRTEPSPGLAAIAEKWRGAGVPVDLAVVPGAAFWQTQEIETVPVLIERTLDLLRRIAT